MGGIGGPHHRRVHVSISEAEEGYEKGKIASGIISMSHQLRG